VRHITVVFNEILQICGFGFSQDNFLMVLVALAALMVGFNRSKHLGFSLVAPGVIGQ
jgi:hypothetical protein